jgi:hypothetical protein
LSYKRQELLTIFVHNDSPSVFVGVRRVLLIVLAYIEPHQSVVDRYGKLYIKPHQSVVDQYGKSYIEPHQSVVDPYDKSHIEPH